MTPAHLFKRQWRTLAAAAALAALAGCSNPVTPTPAAEVVRSAYVVEVRPAGAERLAFVGEVRAARRAELAFPVSGRLVSVAVQPGDRVRAGQVLAQLDELPLRAQVNVANGDIARAEAQLAEARQRMERLRVAQQAGATSSAETTTVKAEVAAAEAALRGAQAQRELAAWSLGQAVLRAPLDGVIGSRSGEPGQAVGPGATVLTVDGQGRELSVLVPGSMALQPGQSVSLRHLGSDQPSRVLRIDGRLEAGGMRRIHLAVPDAAQVGSTWSAVLGPAQAPATAAVQVPFRAVIPAGVAGQGHVLRIARDGRTTEKVAVTLGAMHGDWIDVTAGLATGERVVVAGASAIRPGAAVKPVDYQKEVRS